MWLNHLSFFNRWFYSRRLIWTLSFDGWNLLIWVLKTLSSSFSKLVLRKRTSENLRLWCLAVCFVRITEPACLLWLHRSHSLRFKSYLVCADRRLWRFIEHVWKSAHRSQFHFPAHKLLCVGRCWVRTLTPLQHVYKQLIFLVNPLLFLSVSLLIFTDDLFRAWSKFISRWTLVLPYHDVRNLT